MALADYRLCDVCGGKSFYDASLSWSPPDEEHTEGWWLPGLGDWAVICKECAKSHETVVRPKDDPALSSLTPDD